MSSTIHVVGVADKRGDTYADVVIAHDSYEVV
jgi:hypothetical protein